MTTWPIVPLRGHIDEVSVRKGDTPAEILSVTNTDGFVRSLDIFDKQVFSEDVRNYKLVRLNEIAYNPSRINVGSVARCHLPDGGAVSPMYVVVRCRETLSPQYLVYFLKSDTGKQHITHRCVGAVRFMLRFRDLERIELPLPPRSDQERIVRLLVEVEELHRLRRQADARQLQVRPALLESMLATRAAQGLTCKRTPLLELVDPERGISYGVVQRGDDAPDGIPLIRIGDFANNVFEPKDIVRVAPDISAQYSRTVLKGAEILVSIRGTIGRVAIVPYEAAGWNVAREVAVVPLLPEVSRLFIHSYLLSEEAQHFMRGEARGAAQRGINLQDLRKLPVPMLSKDELERFEELESEVSRLANAQAACHQRLNDLFQSLLHRAFQGML